MMKCASCGEEINQGNNPEFYYNRYGNYCLTCNSRITRNCLKHYQENSEKFSYLFQVDKNKNNEQVWLKKGYIK
jgi:hypothetical protein